MRRIVGRLVFRRAGGLLALVGFLTPFLIIRNHSRLPWTWITWSHAAEYSSALLAPISAGAAAYRVADELREPNVYLHRTSPRHPFARLLFGMTPPYVALVGGFLVGEALLAGVFWPHASWGTPSPGVFAVLAYLLFVTTLGASVGYVFRTPMAAIPSGVAAWSMTMLMERSAFAKLASLDTAYPSIFQRVSLESAMWRSATYVAAAYALLALAAAWTPVDTRNSRIRSHLAISVSLFLVVASTTLRSTPQRVLDTDVDQICRRHEIEVCLHPAWGEVADQTGEVLSNALSLLAPVLGYEPWARMGVSHQDWADTLGTGRLDPYVLLYRPGPGGFSPDQLAALVAQDLAGLTLCQGWDEKQREAAMGAAEWILSGAGIGPVDHQGAAGLDHTDQHHAFLTGEQVSDYMAALWNGEYLDCSAVEILTSWT